MLTFEAPSVEDDTRWYEYHGCVSYVSWPQEECKKLFSAWQSINWTGEPYWHKHERLWTDLFTSPCFSILLFERPRCPNNAAQWKGRLVWPVRHPAIAMQSECNAHNAVQTATLSCNWCSLWWVINVNWHMTFEPGASYMMRRSNAARHQCRVNKTLPQIDNKVHGQARIMLAIYVQYTSHTKKYQKMQHHTFVIY